MRPTAAAREVLRRQQATDERLQSSQLAQLRASAGVAATRASASPARSLDALNLRAPVAGQLTAFSIQVGQSLQRGERLGQIDSAGRNKLRAQVDEFYLGRVARGPDRQRRGRRHAPIRMRVSKIYPQVRNGEFEVDLQFIGAEPRRPAARPDRAGPADARRIRRQARLIPNGGFYNDTGGAWVFVVAPDGGAAIKRQVRLGRRNTDFIEVLEGLEPGERVITSPYTGFAERDRLTSPAMTVGNEGNDPMLSMREVSRVYRTDTVETTALDGIFLDIADGEFVAIMGPSGCGKSTLLNVIGMLDSPTSGSYVFNGTEVAGPLGIKLADFRKRNIGFIFQSFNLVDELSRPRECRACAALPQRPRGRAAHPGRRGDGQGGHRPPRQAPAEPAFRRPAAARRRRPRPCRRTQADPRRRADRQSRHRPWRGGDEDAAGAERRRLDHRHGHPLAGPCRLCRPRRQHARRPHPGRAPRRAA